jgi:hypothetical protein
MLFVRERRKGRKNTKSFSFSYFLPYSRFLRFSRTICFRFVHKGTDILLAQD